MLKISEACRSKIDSLGPSQRLAVEVVVVIILTFATRGNPHFIHDEDQSPVSALGANTVLRVLALGLPSVRWTVKAWLPSVPGGI